MFRHAPSLRALACAALLLACTAAPGAGADSPEARGRAILEQHKDAVVTVQLVIRQRMSMMGMSAHDEESRSDVTGIVIAPDGLTVLSLTGADPMRMFESMMPDLMGDMQMEASVTGVRLLLASGDELPARIVLRDRDLDLAFVRPAEPPAAPLPYIDLADSAAPEILDTVVVLNRLGRVLQRVHSAGFERIEAVVNRPRTLYVPSRDPNTASLGSPAFTLDGKIVGVVLLRAIPGAGGASLLNMMGGLEDSMAAVILPAADILEVSAQAPAADEDEGEEDEEDGDGN